MLDYRCWVERAVRCTESLRKLPGTVEVEIKVEPALVEPEAQKLAKSLRFGLPDGIYYFLTQGSADCSCKYVWKPPKTLIPRLREIFPSKTHIIGLARLCNQQDFEYNQSGCYDMGTSFAEAGKIELSTLWLNSVPFLTVGTGDCFALYVGDNRKGEDYPVVYLDREGYQYPFFAPNFDAFLERWEALHYLGALWLSHFTDPATGYIDPNSPKGKLWRKLVQQALATGV